jgi:hypothetical protein
MASAAQAEATASKAGVNMAGAASRMAQVSRATAYSAVDSANVASMVIDASTGAAVGMGQGADTVNQAIESRNKKIKK